MPNRPAPLSFRRIPRMGAVAPGLALLVLGACVAQRSEPSRSPAPAPVFRPATSEAAKICRRELGEQGAAFTPIDDLLTGGGCNSANAVRLTGLAGDETRFAVTNTDRIACPLAQTVASWARYGVDRAARQMLGSGLARIETFGAYSCRTVAGGSRLSAHANANALDVSAFVLADGRRIAVKSHWDGGSEMERRFLRVIHASACKRFGTVLGPDYNAAHADHFHVELGGAAFCR